MDTLLCSGNTPPPSGLQEVARGFSKFHRQQHQTRAKATEARKQQVYDMLGSCHAALSMPRSGNDSKHFSVSATRNRLALLEIELCRAGAIG